MRSHLEGNRQLRHAVRVALACSVLAIAGTAVAQEKAGTSGVVLEEIIITGSRIAVPNEMSISPVLAVSALDIQQTGVTKIEDLLNSLPQVFASQGSSISNGSDGTAQVNLRGLGAQRTLVLVNGRRLGPGDPRGGSESDLNQIPTELVERVDLLTGGASSVYGADAVAGVVNFILNTHFEGFKFSANYGFNQHHNSNPQGVQDSLDTWNADKGSTFTSAPSHVNTGFTKDLSLVFGMNSADGKGNATFYATYRNVSPVLQSSYDYSACTLSSGFLAGSAYEPNNGHFGCGGSSTAFPGRFASLDQYPSTYTLGANGTLVPYTSANAYNYGPVNYFMRPDERYSAGAFVHYEFSEHADVYSEVQYMNDRSVAQIAPSGAFFGNIYSVNCANPFLSSSMLNSWCGESTAGNVDMLIGRRNVEGGGRQDDLEHQSFRAVIGTRGKIVKGWDYDIYAQLGITSLAQTYQHDMSVRRINNALNVVSDDSGNPVCQSVVDGTDPNCVPWNIFQAGGVTGDALNYLQVPLLLRGEVRQHIVSGNVTGDLGQYGVKLPTAKSGMMINMGVEWRQVQSSTTPDMEFQTGDGAGQGGATLPVSGEIISREAFAEMRLPLIEDKVGAQSLAIESGVRYSDYSTGFTTNSYKFGVEWSPIDELRVRGSYSRAMRAPNIGELFAMRSVALDGATDPCAAVDDLTGAPVAPADYTQAQCARTGLSAGQYGNILPSPASQYNGLTGGAPGLKPEAAKTTSFGVGYQPHWLPNFRAQIDYFDIKIDDVISSIGADTILQQCLNNNHFCDLIHRDQFGSLWLQPSGYITDTLANVGRLRETGADVDLSYRVDIGRFGKINTSFVGTYIDKLETTPIAADTTTTYDCAGYYGTICGTSNPKWRHTLRATWQTPWHGVDVSLAWRYFKAVALDQLSSNPNLAANGTVADGSISNTDAALGARSYLDLTGAIKTSDNVTLRLGIQNLFDKSPPIFGSANCSAGQCNGNTFPQVYDALGRYIFATATVQF